MVKFAGDPPTVAEENPPGPDPDQPPVLGSGTTYYLATTGSDSDPGTITNPFLTLSHSLSVMGPGDNLLIRGGTFTGTSNRNLTWAISGTSGAPITIAAYTGETPIFNGQANGTTNNDRYWFNANGAYNFVTFDGIKLTNMSMTQDGIITLSNQSGGLITDWTFRNMDIQQVAHSTPNPDASSQWVYAGEGVANLMSQSNIYRGPYPGSSVIQGAAISAYGTGIAPSNIVSRGDQFIGVYIGYQLYQDGITGECSDGVFTDCHDNIDLTHHGSVLITGNTGEHGTSSDIYDPNNSSLTTSSGNVFS